MTLGRKVLLDSDPLNLVWLHLARGRRPASAAGVRVLPALDLRSHSGGDRDRFQTTGREGSRLPRGIPRELR